VKSPLVSITSAFFNAESTLEEVVKSVVAQTYTHWELVLLDDGSTDNSFKLVQSICHPQIKVYRNGKNLGRARSLNKLTALCQGKYIARMDADDLCAPLRIEKQVELLESKPWIDLAGTGICYLDGCDHPVGYTQVPQDHEQICRHPSRTFGLCHGSVLGRKVWFERNRYDESLKIAVDFNLWLRTYQKSVFSNIPAPLYFYRLDNSFHIKKLTSARMTSARFLFHYFRSVKNNGAALKGCAAQYLKLIITITAFLSGQRAALMKRRYLPCSRKQRDAFQNEIRTIKGIKLDQFAKSPPGRPPVVVRRPDDLISIYRVHLS